MTVPERYRGPALRNRIALIAESYARPLGRPLVAPGGDVVEALWAAPEAVVAHGTEADPAFFFANRAALLAFAADLDRFIGMPSRLSAEAPERSERQALLDRVSRDGFIADYAGVRVTLSGRRFRIADAAVWNLIDAQGRVHGQAAAFAPPVSEAEAEVAAYVARIEASARRIETPCAGGTMVWRAWGEGEPLVLTHGAQGDWAHWIRNVETLARTRLVLAADLPGHGDSALPAASDQRDISAVLAEGLPRIVGERAVDCVGFSFGGVALAHFAAYHPRQVRRLVLVGCGGLDTPLGAVRVGRVKGLTGEARQEALKANLLGLMLDDPDSADALARHLLVTMARKARLEGAAALVLPDRLLRILPEVRVPVDAIWGERDRPHPDPARQEAAIRRSHPSCDLRVIAGAGHWAMYERPEAFEAALLDLLRR